MRKYNDGTGESNILQNQFTAYLMTALRRRKAQYIRSKIQLLQYELMLEEAGDSALSIEDLDMTQGLPLLEQMENIKLRRLLERTAARDLHIFFAKVLEDRSLVEIAVELGLGYNTVAAVYYRLIGRLKKELGGDDR